MVRLHGRYRASLRVSKTPRRVSLIDVGYIFGERTKVRAVKCNDKLLPKMIYKVLVRWNGAVSDDHVARDHCRT